MHSVRTGTTKQGVRWQLFPWMVSISTRLCTTCHLHRILMYLDIYLKATQSFNTRQLLGGTQNCRYTISIGKFSSRVSLRNGFLLEIFSLGADPHLASHHMSLTFVVGNQIITSNQKNKPLNSHYTEIINVFVEYSNILICIYCISNS